MYEALAEKLREAGLRPPPFKAFEQTPSSMRSLLCEVLRKQNSGRLPDGFMIVGDWVSCVVMADGKTVLVNGEGLELQTIRDKRLNGLQWRSSL